MLSKLIVGEGHEVEYRRSGEEALELLKTEHFDAVLITMYAPHPTPPRPAPQPTLSCATSRPAPTPLIPSLTHLALSPVPAAFRNMPDMTGVEASIDLRCVHQPKTPNPFPSLPTSQCRRLLSFYCGCRRHEDLMNMYKTETGDEKLKIIAMVQVRPEAVVIVIPLRSC